MRLLISLPDNAQSKFAVGVRWLFIAIGVGLVAAAIRGYIHVYRFFRREMGKVRFDSPNQNPLPISDFWQALEEGDYARAWDKTAPYFQRDITKDEWVARMERERRPLGKSVARKIISNVVITPMSRTNVEILATFAQGQQLVERVSNAVQPNGEWRVEKYDAHPVASEKLAQTTANPVSISKKPWQLIAVGLLFLAIGFPSTWHTAKAIASGKFPVGLDTGLISIPIGIGLLRLRPWWRKTAIFLFLLSLAVFAVASVFALTGVPLVQLHGGYVFGFRIEDPVLGGLASLGYLALAAWQYSVLIRPDVKALFNKRGFSRPLIEWAVLLVILAVISVGHALVGMHRAGKDPATLANSPQDLRKLPNAQVIEAGLAKPLSGWAWQELQKRAEKGHLESAEVRRILDGYTAWMRHERPEGYNQPLHWFGGLLDTLHRQNLLVLEETNVLAFLEAYYGSPSLDPLPRIRENASSLVLRCQWCSSWLNWNLGFELLNEMRSISVDGVQVSVQDGWRKGRWKDSPFTAALRLPKLTPGKHKIRCEVESALVADRDMAGLAESATSSDWPPAQRRWTRVCEGEFQVYTTGTEIVRLTNDPALNPVVGGALSARSVIIRSENGHLKATVSFNVALKPELPVSVNVALHLAGQTIHCGNLYSVNTKVGIRSLQAGNSSEFTAEIGPLDAQIKEAEILLTPCPEAVEGYPYVDRIWGKEIVISHVPLSRQDLYGAKAVKDFGGNATRISASDFHIGQTYFPKGDSIKITSVERSKTQMTVKGLYHLVSAHEASMWLDFTLTNNGKVPNQAASTYNIHISQGWGDFELSRPLPMSGLPHVSMYNNNRSFADIYFGNEAEAAAESKLHLGHDRTPNAAPEQDLSFGPVVERVVTEHGGIDLDAGLSYPNLPPEVEQSSIEDKLSRASIGLEERGVDALHMEPDGLLGCRCEFEPLRESDWSLITSEELGRKLELNDLRPPGNSMRANIGMPSTAAFKTHDGAIGILQILGTTGNPRGVRIRYKLVQPTPVTETSRERQYLFALPQSGGLKENAVISFRGRPVGRVASFRSDGTAVVVTGTITNLQLRLLKGDTARVIKTGLLANPQLEIVRTSESGEELAPGSTISDSPTPPAASESPQLLRATLWSIEVPPSMDFRKTSNPVSLLVSGHDIRAFPVATGLVSPGRDGKLLFTNITSEVTDTNNDIQLFALNIKVELDGTRVRYSLTSTNETGDSPLSSYERSATIGSFDLLSERFPEFLEGRKMIMAILFEPASGAYVPGKASARLKPDDFGPVTERDVQQPSAPHYQWFDLDAEQSVALRNYFKAGFDPELKPKNQAESGVYQEEFKQLKVASGVDISTTEGIPPGSEKPPRLIGLEMVVLPVSAEKWETITAAELKTLLAGKPLKGQSSMEFRDFQNSDPATYLFRTFEGGMGILQITGYTSSPHQSVTIRYKLVATSKP
ncbi:MAG TPA: DUF4019 domain-containing protein [Candidatus Paceibacterota bacterium]|nr:DUF4019 domain-containing protein [Candidatus Paceibacterota bacterium]